MPVHSRPLRRRRLNLRKGGNMLFKCIFYSAERSQLLDYNPSAGISAKGGKPTKKKEALTDEQIDLSNDIIKNLRSFEPQQEKYIKTALVELGGQRYTLFNIEELKELYRFDLEKIRSLQIPIDVCKYCGHAFVKTSRDVMCSQCRIERRGEVEKQRRWNENEVNREFAKFTNALRKRKDAGTISPYYAWITEKRKKGEVTIEWLESWRKIDKGYQKLCRYFKRAEEATEQVGHSEEWEKSYKDFPHKMNDPEKWVKEWLEKIK